jgi:hypothetical protein
VIMCPTLVNYGAKPEWRCDTATNHGDMSEGLDVLPWKLLLLFGAYLPAVQPHLTN